MIGFIDRRRHDKLRTLLSSYTDGEVSEGERRRVDAHLAECPECSAEIASIRGMSQLMSRLPQIAVPRSFVLSQAPAPVRSPGYGLWTGSFATAAAAVLLVVLLAGDAFGLVTQSSPTLQESRSQEASAPAAQPLTQSRLESAPSPESFAAPVTPAAAPAAPSADSAPAAAVPAPASTPAPELLQATAEETTGAGATPGPELAQATAEEATAGAAAAPGEADASAFAGAGAPAATPPAVMVLEGPTPEIGVASMALPEPLDTASTGVGGTLADVQALPEPGSSGEVQGSAAVRDALPTPGTTEESVERAKSVPGLTQSKATVESQNTGVATKAPMPPESSSDGSREITLAADESALVKEEESGGIRIPLRQLQVAMAVALIALLSTTLLIYRKRPLP